MQYFGSEIGSGFGERGGTPLPIIRRRRSFFSGERESVAVRESAVGRGRKKKNLPTTDSRAATLSRSPEKKTPDRRL